ncbi:MAG: TolC family protein [Chlorobium sp.]|nr:MAG: TolC family protein [Chlorobium sp.]
MFFRLFSYFLIAAFFFVCPSTGTSAETAEKKFSLARCIEIALNNSTSARKAQNTLKLQGSDVLRSYGSFLPRLSASASYSPYVLSRSYTQDNSGITSLKSESKSLDLILTSSLNLFNGFRDYASLQAALKTEDAARYSLSRALQTIVFDVTQSYYQVLLNRELFEIARENLLLSRDQLTLTNRQFQIGLKSIIDRDQQQADEAETRLSVIKAETRLQQSMLELVRRMQIDPTTKFSLEALPDSLNTPVSAQPDPESLVTIAFQRRSDLKSRELAVKAATWQVTQARSPFYPRLDLNFNVSTGGIDYLHQSIGNVPFIYSYPPLSNQLSNSIGYSVGLNLSWTIFDGFQTRYNIESAKINNINQQLDYEDLKNYIFIDLHQAAKEYTSAWMQIETAKISLKAAQSAFDGIKRKYDLGATSFIELSSARASLFNARSNLSQATYNLALQKNILDFTTGNITLP